MAYREKQAKKCTLSNGNKHQEFSYKREGCEFGVVSREGKKQMRNGIQVEMECLLYFETSLSGVTVCQNMNINMALITLS